MKYLCIVYQDEKKLESMAAEEEQALTDESLDYDEALRQSGHYINSNALEFANAATTVRVKGGKVLLTDGPFAETNEQMGGYILIEAKDLNEAIRVAAGIPPVRLGCIEIRPVRELTRSKKQ
jgi:hypothetical protein